MRAKITWNSTAVQKEIDKKEKTAITKSCLLLVRDIKQSMKSTPRLIERAYKRQKGAGRYKRGKRQGMRIESKFHHPSAPGYPPAIDTGRLVGSISYNTSWSGKDRGSVSGTAEASDGVSRPVALSHRQKIGVVGTNITFGGGDWNALILELGTRKMKARPFIRPAFHRNLSAIREFFK